MNHRRRAPRLTLLLRAVSVGAALPGVLLLAACARTPAPSAEALDWSSLADRQMILVRTRKEDGELRTTRLWIVVLEGHGYLRSADTRWSRDVAREPSFRLIVDSVSYPVRGTRVPYGTDEHAAVMEAFSAKYGLQSRTVLGIYSLIGRYSEPADARILRLEAERPNAR